MKAKIIDKLEYCMYIVEFENKKQEITWVSKIKKLKLNIGDTVIIGETEYKGFIIDKID
jgi:translation initiation factor IF-1